MKDLIEKVTEMAFVLGSEVNESNASVMAEFIDTLYQVRQELLEISKQKI